jgi:hypothetical protein
MKGKSGMGEISYEKLFAVKEDILKSQAAGISFRI